MGTQHVGPSTKNFISHNSTLLWCYCIHARVSYRGLSGAARVPAVLLGGVEGYMMVRASRNTDTTPPMPLGTHMNGSPTACRLHNRINASSASAPIPFSVSRCQVPVLAAAVVALVTSACSNCVYKPEMQYLHPQTHTATATGT